jgi:hypothetical protein
MSNGARETPEIHLPMRDWRRQMERLWSLAGGHGLDEVALQLLGVAPGELQLLVRHDDLAGVAERLGEGVRGFKIPVQGAAPVGCAGLDAG